MSLCALRVGAVTSYPCHLNSQAAFYFYGFRLYLQSPTGPEAVAGGRAQPGVPDSRRRLLLPGDTVPRRKAPAHHRGQTSPREALPGF